MDVVYTVDFLQRVCVCVVGWGVGVGEDPPLFLFVCFSAEQVPSSVLSKRKEFAPRGSSIRGWGGGWGGGRGGGAGLGRLAFVTFYLLFRRPSSFEKGVLSKRKEFAPRGSSFFL